MISFDGSLNLDGKSSFGLDVQRGLLYLSDQVVPVFKVGDTWMRDTTRPIAHLDLGYVPVVPVGGA